MANTLYPPGLDQFGLGDIHWTTDDIRAVLINTGAYTYNAAHTNFGQVSGIIGSPVSLSGKTVSGGGILNASPTTFTAVTGGTAVSAVLVYKWTGTNSTSWLIGWYDTTSTGGFSIDPAGGNVTVNWPTGTNKLGKL